MVVIYFLAGLADPFLPVLLPGIDSEHFSVKIPGTTLSLEQIVHLLFMNQFL